MGDIDGETCGDMDDGIFDLYGIDDWIAVGE